VKTISEAEKSTIQITWKTIKPKIGPILCFGGAFLYIISIADLIYLPFISSISKALSITLPFAILITTGALLALKYPRGGSLLCILFGLISLVQIVGWSNSWLYFFAIILTITGGIIGLIIGILIRNPIELTWENLHRNLLTIISSILCLVGGILFIWSSPNWRYDGWGFLMMGAIFFGIMIIIGGLLGLKYHIGGSLLSLLIGTIFTLTCFTHYEAGSFTYSALCITRSSLFLLAAIFSIGGSIIGLIGGIIKRRSQTILKK